VAERFEALRDILFEHGYAVDPGPRGPSEWNERHWEDPPTGLARIKGMRLADLEDEDSDFDPKISVSIEEYWSRDHVDQAQSARGFYLVEYSYHAHFHGTNQRRDFDPPGHPDIPYHQHPPPDGERRQRMDGPIDPADAIKEFHAWIESKR
jgi:hypothetical protein